MHVKMAFEQNLALGNSFYMPMMNTITIGMGKRSKYGRVRWVTMAHEFGHKALDHHAMEFDPFTKRQGQEVEAWQWAYDQQGNTNRRRQIATQGKISLLTYNVVGWKPLRRNRAGNMRGKGL